MADFNQDNRLSWVRNDAESLFGVHSSRFTAVHSGLCAGIAFTCTVLFYAIHHLRLLPRNRHNQKHRRHRDLLRIPVARVVLAEALVLVAAPVQVPALALPNRRVIVVRHGVLFVILPAEAVVLLWYNETPFFVSISFSQK